MSYSYEAEKPRLFTDEGQRTLLKMYKRVNRILDECGAVRMQEALSGFCGDSWFLLACVDRMVELDEIREITGSDVPGQHRVFVRRDG